MKRAWTGLMLGVSLVTVGCQSKAYDQNLAMRQQNNELQDRVRTLETELNSRPDPGAVSALQGQLSDRDKTIADLQNKLQTQLQTPPADASQESKEGFGGITVTRDDKAGTLTVNLPGDVLFASGDSSVKESAKATLNKIAVAIKKDFGGKKIFVDGHSDSDPISRTKNKYKDNLDLSAARARTVSEYLEGQGLDKKLIGTRALSDTSPKTTKAASRRVEIVVATR